MMTSNNVTSHKNSSRDDLVRSDWGPFESLHDDIDRILGRYISPAIDHMPSVFHRNSAAAHFARMDVTNGKSAIDVKVDVPGMDVKNIDVTLTDNLLTIKGTRESETKEEDADYYRLERSFGSFQRQIELLTEIDEKKIDATVEHGVLSIHLPKSARAKSKEKKISVKAS